MNDGITFLMGWPGGLLLVTIMLASYFVGRWHGQDDRGELQWRLNVAVRVLRDARDIWRNDPFNVARDADMALRAIENNDFAENPDAD